MQWTTPAEPVVFLAVLIYIRRDRVGGVRSAQQDSVRAMHKEEDAVTRRAARDVLY